jgi:hypothetical protein
VRSRRTLGGLRRQCVLCRRKSGAESQCYWDMVKGVAVEEVTLEWDEGCKVDLRPRQRDRDRVD